jgi:hypothetical protein
MSNMLINRDLTLEQELAAIEAGLRAPKRRKAKAPAVSESTVQRAIIKALALSGIMAVHVPNAAKRSINQAMTMKRDGLVKGFPDLILYGHDGRHALLEVKPPHWKEPAQPPPGRRVTEAYHEWAYRLRLYANLRERGFEVEVVQSVDDAIRYLRAWGWLR